MNEEDLKKIWQADENAPKLDLLRLQESIVSCESLLRKKARFDIWAQSATAVLTLIPIYFYPKLIVLVYGFDRAARHLVYPRAASAR